MSVRLRDRIAVHAAHAGLLAALPAALGRAAALARPQAIAAIASSLALASIEARAHRSADASRFGARGTHLALASALGLLLTSWLAIGWPGAGAASPWTWVGAPLFAAGVALRVSAMRALGDAFTSETVIVPGRRVARAGIIAFCKHPSDLGLLLVAAGLVVLAGGGVAIAAALGVVAPTVALRVRDEERLLAGRNSAHLRSLRQS